MEQNSKDNPDGGADRADAIAHLNALLGLAGNREAIDNSIKRLRKAAQGYSDNELTRFAQLIIRYEHPPGEWREKLLAEVQQRDDALKEIAMSIDHSWLPTETEDEVFMDELRNEIIRSYPNPDREGCPNESDLRRVVLGEINQFSDSEALMKHTLTCGPCTRQLGILLKEKARRSAAAR
jgi:hypothetical protein